MVCYNGYNWQLTKWFCQENLELQDWSVFASDWKIYDLKNYRQLFQLFKLWTDGTTWLDWLSSLSDPKSVLEKCKQNKVV